MNKIQSILLAALAATTLQSKAATPLFSDDFDTDTSANWLKFEGSTSGTIDSEALFSFDYSALSIPPAPSGTGGSTKGLKLTVNKLDTTPELAAISLYPRGQSFSNNFSLKFDMWMNYNGPAFGSAGSTEHATFGVGHLADKLLWFRGEASDGIFFGVAGEAGASPTATVRDYQSYQSSPGVGPFDLGLDGGFLDRDRDGVVELDSGEGQPPDHPLRVIFPSPPFGTPGAPGKQWVKVELRMEDNVLTWLMNGWVIARRTDTAESKVGNIMLGYQDLFTSIPSPTTETYVVYDNVRVEQLAPADKLPDLTITATDPEAAEPGTDSASIRFSRPGADTSQPLTIQYRLEGSATPGVDYATNTSSITIPAGSVSADLTITAIDDPKGEQDESIRVFLQSGNGYQIGLSYVADVTIKDNNDVTAVTLSATDTRVYERLNVDRAPVKVVRLGDTSSNLVVNLTYSGTATTADFEGAVASVTIAAGQTEVLLDLVGKDDAAVEPEETLQLSLNPSPNYVLGATTNVTITIRDDDLPVLPVLYSDNFDQDTSAAWQINQANDDSLATFNYNYAADGIPPAPRSSGTTRGVKLEANMSAGIFTGLSVSPLDQAFGGDYLLRADMWLNYNGPLEAGGTGSTRVGSAGVMTSGLTPQWAGGTQDSLWFGVTGDGGSGVDYRVYAAATGFTTGAGSGNAVFAAQGGTGDNRNNTHPYYSVFGGVAAPAAQLAIQPEQTGRTTNGVVGMAWRDVMIRKEGNIVRWYIDGVLLATVDMPVIGFTPASSNIFLGHFDINAGLSGNQTMNFALFDNVTVYALNVGLPEVAVAATDAAAAEPADAGQFNITRTGPATSPLTVQVSVGGNAQPGTDYTALTTPVIIPAGATNVLLNITPINDSRGEEIENVVLTIQTNANYSIGASRAVVLIADDADPAPTGPVLFAENFETDASVNWNINKHNPDTHAIFGFDYATAGIPAAPGSSGTTKGLKLQANLTAAVFTGLSVSPKDKGFTGDYMLKADMWINFNGPAPSGGSGSTKVTSAGVMTKGTTPQWAAGAQDSVWFGATGDGGSSVDYRAYSPAAATGYTAPTGVFFAGTSTDPDARNNVHPYYERFGNVEIPAAQTALDPDQSGPTAPGAAGFAWRDVRIVKSGNTVTYYIDRLPIAQVDTTTIAADILSTNIFLGHFDINATTSGKQEWNFGLYDNLQVIALGVVEPPTIRITSITSSAGQVRIRFTSTSGEAASFAIVSSPQVNGPYQNEAATIVSTGAGQFEATLPANGAIRFYQIKGS